jgi:hypothetical protein
VVRSGQVGRLARKVKSRQHHRMCRAGINQTHQSGLLNHHIHPSIHPSPTLCPNRLHTTCVRHCAAHDSFAVVITATRWCKIDSTKQPRSRHHHQSMSGPHQTTHTIKPTSPVASARNPKRAPRRAESGSTGINSSQYINPLGCFGSWAARTLANHHSPPPRCSIAPSQWKRSGSPVHISLK